MLPGRSTTCSGDRTVPASTPAEIIGTRSRPAGDHGQREWRSILARLAGPRSPRVWKRSLRSGRPDTSLPDFGGDPEQQVDVIHRRWEAARRSPPCWSGSSSVQQQGVDQCPKLTTSTCRPSSRTGQAPRNPPTGALECLGRQVGPPDGRRHDQWLRRQSPRSHRRWAEGHFVFGPCVRRVPGSGPVGSPN